MKKSCLLLLLSFIFVSSKAQKFSENYLGEDFKLYKGVLLKFDNKSIAGFNHVFYAKMDYVQSLFDDRVIYPDAKYKFNTVKDSLFNRVFKVEDIVDKTGAAYARETYLEKPIFILVDTLTKQKIYFKYDAKYEHAFPFLTEPIKFKEADLCSEIEREVDDFTGEVKLSSPLSKNNEISTAIIYKYIKKGRIVHYLSLRTIGSTLNVAETGVQILFTDGTKWTRGTKIDVDADNDGYEYSAFITLTPTDLITFSTKSIKKFRLYIYDEAVNSIDAQKFKLYVKCIRKAK